MLEIPLFQTNLLFGVVQSTKISLIYDTILRIKY